MANSGRRRWWGVVLVVVCVLAWWLPREDEASPLAVLPSEAPPRDVPAVAAQAKAPVVPPSEAPMDEEEPEPAAPPDAGALRTVTLVYRLGPGNTRAVFAPMQVSELQRACDREAEACESLLHVGDHPPFILRFELEGEPGHTRLVGLSKDERSRSEFTQCVLRGLRGQTFLETKAPTAGCQFRALAEKRSPEGRQVDAIIRCVGTDASAEAILVATVVRATNGQVVTSEPEVSAMGRLDLSTESCIRLALQQRAVAVTPEEEARFSPYRQLLTVVLAGDTARQTVDPGEVQGIIAVMHPFRDGPVASAEAQQAAARRADEAEAKLRANDVVPAYSAAVTCLELNRAELRCHRVKALAWFTRLSTEPDSLDTAVVDWLSYVKRAPADDPDARRMQVAIIAAGWRE